MANNDRWRDDRERNRHRDDRRWGDRSQDYARGYGRDDRERSGRGMEGTRDIYGGRYGSDDQGTGMADRDQDRWQNRDYGRDNYGHGGDERGFGGNDYNRGFYGADQGWGGRERGPHQDSWGYRGGRSGWDRFSDEVSSWFGDDEAARRREQDAHQGDQGAQHHRGRGPKGYTRSDERIREDVNDRLTDDPYVDASEIEVSVSSCEVTLSGTVDSREAKRRAEDIAEHVSGVMHVQNNLRVSQSGSAGGQSATSGLSSSMGKDGTVGATSTGGAAGQPGTSKTKAG